MCGVWKKKGTMIIIIHLLLHIHRAHTTTWVDFRIQFQGKASSTTLGFLYENFKWSFFFCLFYFILYIYIKFKHTQTKINLIHGSIN